MFNLIFFAFILFCICMILISLAIVISKKSFNWREKFSPFECGYDFFSYSRIPFSMRFFLIAIIFIIFDVEIALILPIIPSVFKSMIFKWLFTSFSFLIILMLGVFLEWKEESFDWKF